MKKSSETSSPSTQQPEKTATKTVEILLEMPTIITDASARKQAANILSPMPRRTVPRLRSSWNRFSEGRPVRLMTQDI